MRVFMDGVGSIPAAMADKSDVAPTSGVPSIVRYLKQDSDLKVRVQTNTPGLADHVAVSVGIQKCKHNHRPFSNNNTVLINAGMAEAPHRR